MLPTPIKDTDDSFSLEQTCQRFTLAEIQSATHNFHEAVVIGRGGFGKVYKCPTGSLTVSEVAVKRLDAMSSQGSLEFESEVKVLSKLRHANLVSLVGYCNEGSELALVYEFIPNGTLKDHLAKVDSALSWLQRLKICIGAARGLDYLHTGISTRDGVIHRDVKTSNILLDANFAAKISDFGLAKVGPIDQTRTFVSTGVKGTFGYMDPCYFYTGKLTRKSDVYAFGVVLFEVLSGKEAVDSTLDEEQWGLAPWAQDQIKIGNINQIVDSRLMGQISKKCLKEFASLACLCLSIQPKQRPTMAEVVVKLESILSQERECAKANSVVDEGRFMYKVRYFFTGKVDAMPNDAMLNGEVANKPLMVDGTKHIQESKNRSLRSFTYLELVSATDDFKHVDHDHSRTLGETIYKGWVDKRTYAPTKRGVGMKMYVTKKYVLESKIVKIHLKLEDFNHPNLIKLLGYCLHEKQLFCIYEHIPDTSLDRYLYGGPGITTLSWVARVKIAVGAAEGLSFLHQRKYPAYLQFKSCFILVDKDFNARLSDFQVEDSFMDSLYYDTLEWPRYFVNTLDGPIGPIEPADENEYIEGAELGIKREIFAFGVLLLELLTGEVYDVTRPIKTERMITSATHSLAERKLKMVMDPKLKHNYSSRGAFKLAQLILKCLQPTQDKRPSMEEILQVLYQCYDEEK